MIIDFSKPILDIDGAVALVDGKPLTLKSVAVNSLTATFDDERHITGEDKMKRFVLALSINGTAEPLDITPEQATLLKQLIGKGYSTLVVGRAYEILNG